MIPVLIHYVVPTVHVLACLFLIVVVLLQTGKGADMGAVFGGGSQTLFGSSGAGNFLTRLTTATALAFMLTSLILTYGQSRPVTSNLIQQLPTPTAGAPRTSPPMEAPSATAESNIPVAPAKGGGPAAAPAGDQAAAPAEAPAQAPAGEPAPEE